MKSKKKNVLQKEQKGTQIHPPNTKLFSFWILLDKKEKRSKKKKFFFFLKNGELHFFFLGFIINWTSQNSLFFSFFFVKTIQMNTVCNLLQFFLSFQCFSFLLLTFFQIRSQFFFFFFFPTIFFFFHPLFDPYNFFFSIDLLNLWLINRLNQLTFVVIGGLVKSSLLHLNN